MKWTGERLETFVFNYNTIEHLHRYSITFDFIKDKTVADVACGEGYGSHLISQYARHVIGIDIDEETVTKAKTKYESSNLNFRVGNAIKIPIESSTIDVVISFETIEHITQHDEMLKEIKRILTRDGILIISSPDKKYYTDVPNYRNNFHLKELYKDEFKELMQKYFENYSYYFQRMIKGSLIIDEQKQNRNALYCYSGNYTSIERNEFTPLYNICVASDAIVQKLPMSIFENASIELIMNEVVKNTCEAKYNKKLDQITQSWSYRIGRILTFPARMFR